MSEQETVQNLWKGLEVYPANYLIYLPSLNRFLFLDGKFQPKYDITFMEYEKRLSGCRLARAKGAVDDLLADFQTSFSAQAVHEELSNGVDLNTLLSSTEITVEKLNELLARAGYSPVSRATVEVVA